MNELKDWTLIMGSLVLFYVIGIFAIASLCSNVEWYIKIALWLAFYGSSVLYGKSLKDKI